MAESLWTLDEVVPMTFAMGGEEPPAEGGGLEYIIGSGHFGPLSTG